MKMKIVPMNIKKLNKSKIKKLRKIVGVIVFSVPLLYIEDQICPSIQSLKLYGTANNNHFYHLG